MSSTHTPLEKERLRYKPPIPNALKDLKGLTTKNNGELPPLHSDLKQLFPHLAEDPPLAFAPLAERPHRPLRVGVVLSGGQAAGGHNVIAGIYDALKELNGDTQLFGFLNGPGGIVGNKYIPLTKEKIDAYRNMGGFDMIGSGRTKIETPEQFDKAEETVKALALDGLVIIGGDDSNTNAAFLAEHFIRKEIPTRVIGVPKTIDGDLKSKQIEISFGFDSACKTYSEFIGNVLRDALSQKKYCFFVKLMGRSASHIALECALQTHPNLTLVGEEIEAKQMTLKQIATGIADVICKRYDAGKEYGVFLIPEGIIEFIPECRVLIQELNALLAKEAPEAAVAKLSAASAACFKSLPKMIQDQLLLERDPHGNVQVSKIETERLFIEMVKSELKARKFAGNYSAQPLFCGYEGRSCYPSNFDSNYCYALGLVAALLIDAQATGYMALIQDLTQPVEKWSPAAYPLVAMMEFVERAGKKKPVVAKALVDLKGPAFTAFAAERSKWEMEDDYRFPGPIQFGGPKEITEATTITLQLEVD